MNYSEMFEQLNKRSIEILKSLNYKESAFDGVGLDDGKVWIALDGDMDDCYTCILEFTIDEFNDVENGIQKYKERLQKEEEERKRRNEERRREKEEMEKQLRYEMYLKYKEEFENENT